MYNKQNLGKWGEELACKYLEDINYNIVERNFSCHQGEVDIVAYDNTCNELVFVEVKTRSNFNYGVPTESINYIKKSHMKRSIEYYLYKKRLFDVYVRVDAIEIVVWNGKYKLNHLKGVLE